MLVCCCSRTDEDGLEPIQSPRPWTRPRTVGLEECTPELPTQQASIGPIPRLSLPERDNIEMSVMAATSLEGLSGRVTPVSSTDNAELRILGAASPSKAHQVPRLIPNGRHSPRLIKLPLAAVKAGQHPVGVGALVTPPVSGGRCFRRPASGRSPLTEWYQDSGKGTSAQPSACNSPAHSTLSAWLLDGTERPDGRTPATDWYKLTVTAPNSPDK